MQLSGIGDHFEGDVKAHTAHVLDQMKTNLEAVGSSMEKVLKVNVYLNDLKDYTAMNEVFRGRFGDQPGVRTRPSSPVVPVHRMRFRGSRTATLAPATGSPVLNSVTKTRLA